MKKIFIVGFLLILLALGVSAADLTTSTTSLSVSQKPTRSFSTSFTATNNGTTNLSLSVALSGSELSGYNISFSPSSFNLNVGSTPQTVTITGRIPKNVDISTKSLFKGTITISGSGVSESIGLNVNVENPLLLDSVKAKVDGKSKSIDSGDKIRDVKPGSDVVFIGDLSNLFTDDEDFEIRDITVNIVIEGIDEDEDLEEETDVDDINADEEDTFSVDFQIPENVDDGDYDVTLTVDAEDENGAAYNIEWIFTLELEKEKHDIWITKATVSPSKISCSRNINPNIGLKNQGTNDEDEVVLSIESAGLGIDFEDTAIPELEEGTDDDSEYDKTYSFTISDDVRAGTYPIMVKVYYDTDTQSDSETIDLIVEKCAVEEPKEEEPSEVVIVTPPKEKTPTETEEEPEIITEPLTETTEASLLQSNTYLILLAAGIGVAVIVIIIMIIVLFTMRKRV